MIYPISFSFPKELIVPYVPFKTSHTASHQYQFTDSEPYLQNYGRAIFGSTDLKCGWDCLRHYEILSQGTIPLFKRLPQCPSNTMRTFPKEQVITLMGKYGDLEFADIMRISSSELYEDLDSLLRYMRTNMTTEETVDYMLRCAGVADAKEILFITNHPTAGDYLSETIAHGLKSRFQGKCDTFPDYPSRYTDFSLEESKKLYGKGFNYTRLLPDSYKTSLTRTEIQEKITSRTYDHIILYLHHMSSTIPFFSAQDSHPLFKYYTPTEISVVCGHDCDSYWSKELQWYIRMNHNCPFVKDLLPGHPVFVREFGEEDDYNKI